MGFTATAKVPLMYRWDDIENGLNLSLSNQGIELTKELSSHYAWLLQITSWSYGIDWNPLEDTVTVSLPFEGPLQNLNTLQDENDYDVNIAQDKIAAFLRSSLERVPLRRLLAHFARQ